MLQAIMFDLDGTLLPMDNDYFVKVYFGYLAKAAEKWGYTDKEKLIAGIWKGVAAMVTNSGGMTNGQAFWKCFAGEFGDKVYDDMALFDHFYQTDFNLAKESVFPTELAKTAVETARRKAGKVILATNPIFPRCADVTRLAWIGLTPEDFDLVTDYDNCCFCKPNPKYYEDILKRCNLEASECVMIGNDVEEDMVAAGEAGIRGWLLSDYVINRKERPITCPQGSYRQMIGFLETL